MKAIDLKKQSVAQLVERFIAIGIEQDDTLWAFKTAKYNRLFRIKIALVAELKSRDGDQRRALMPLYRHDNLQVQYIAAKATLALAPLEARQVLERLSEDKDQPQALHAGMTLFNLDNGVFKPT